MILKNLIFGILTLINMACHHDVRTLNNTDATVETENSTDFFETFVPGVGTIKSTLISKVGGRVSWYTGSANHKKIAYDAKSKLYDLGLGIIDFRTDVYTMNSDGSDIECITCQITALNELHDAIIKKRESEGDIRPGFFLGQPEWHADGKHLIIQVENLNSKHTKESFNSFGQDQDLWIINTETKEAFKILEHLMAGNAFLHPRFSKSGNKLIFGARNNGGSYGNIWDHWYIGVVDFDINADPENMISNISFIRPSGRGLYETTGFIADSETEFSYSFTPFESDTVLPYVDDGYVTDVNGSFATNLINLPNYWDEKPRFSPSGDHIVIMSNRFDDSWEPIQGPSTLTTELYIGVPREDLIKLTDFKSIERYENTRLLITDHEWDQTGSKIVVQVDPEGNSDFEFPEIWLIELPRSY